LKNFIGNIYGDSSVPVVELDDGDVVMPSFFSLDAENMGDMPLMKLSSSDIGVESMKLKHR